VEDPQTSRLFFKKLESEKEAKKKAGKRNLKKKVTGKPPTRRIDIPIYLTARIADSSSRNAVNFSSAVHNENAFRRDRIVPFLHSNSDLVGERFSKIELYYFFGMPVSC